MLTPGRLATCAVLLTGFALGPQLPAMASVKQATVVSENPSDATPHLAPDNTVPQPAAFAMEELGNRMYVGGKFHALQDPARTTTTVQPFLASFDASSGALAKAFAPRLDGAVWAVKAAAGGVYVGGEFTTVNGVKRRGLVKLDPLTGAVDPAFAPALDGNVSDMRVVGNRLIVGGYFTKRLLALDLATGADTGYLDLGIAGTTASTAPRGNVYRMAVSPDGTRLVAVGNFATVGGQVRAQAFMVDLGASSGSLDPWYYTPLTKFCRRGDTVPSYLRDVDFSANGKWFVLVATGGASNAGDVGSTVCDGAARFETAVPHPTRATWFNYTGGDTLDSVAVTGAAVYVSGHQRWLNNAQGNNTCVNNCVSREGIGALDAATGKALPYNPTKTRGVGGRDLLATSTGLWVMSDGAYYDKEYHYGIAFAPLP